MNRPKFLLTSLLIACASIAAESSSLYAQWKPTKGPYGGEILALSAKDSLLLAGTYCGAVYRSTNQGDDWSWSSWGLDAIPTQGFGYGFACTETEVFQVSQRGIYISMDGGVSWSACNGGLESVPFHSKYDNYRRIVSVGERVFLGTSNGMFEYSRTDHSWVAIQSTWEGDPYLCENRLIAVTVQGIYSSTDTARTWTKLNLAIHGITSVAALDSELFFGTVTEGAWSVTGDSAITKLPGVASHQTGPDTWTSAIVYDVATVGDKVILGTDYGAITLSKQNDTWSVLRNEKSLNVRALTVSGGRIFAGTQANGVYVTNDTGLTWHESSKGINARSPDNLVYGDPMLFVRAENKIFGSRDGGESWSRVDPGFEEIKCLAAEPGYLYAGVYGDKSSGGVYKYSIAGEYWKRLDLPEQGLWQTVTLSTFRGSLVAGGGNGIAITSNSGKTWQELQLENLRSPIMSLSLVGDVLYAGALEGSLYQSGDGITWSLKSSNCPVPVGSVAGVGSTLVVCKGMLVGASNNKIAKSSDYGVTWNVVGQELVDAPYVVIAVEGCFLAGTARQGVWCSTDLGETWHPKNERMVDARINSMLAVGDTLFACIAQQGVWGRATHELLGTHEKPAVAKHTPEIFPDPAKDNIRIKNMRSYEGPFDVTDCLGRVWPLNATSDADDVLLNVAALPNGLYFIPLTDPQTETVSFCIRR